MLKSSSKRILGNKIKNVSYFSNSSENTKTSEIITSATPTGSNLRSRVVTSQFSSSGNISGITYSSPSFYQPQYTPSSWQIPTTRVEIYKWAKFWHMNEPKVARGINFYATFPMSNFELECPNAAVREYFEKLIRKLNLKFYLPEILREFFLMGDAFVMMEISCDQCHGRGYDENGNECDHKGATWKGISILDPLTVEVVPTPLSHESYRVYMTPNNDLKRIVQEKRPKEIYEQLSNDLKKLVLSNQKIPLDPLTITHFKHEASPYSTYGTSLIRSLFQTLAYKDKLRQAAWIVAERLILPIKVAKVGSQERLANQEDIDDVLAKLTEIANDPTTTLVTPHDFELDFVGTSGKVLQLTNEMEQIENEFIDGLGLTKAIISGEGPTYANASIAIEVLIQRLESVREMISHWLEERVFRPIAEFNGFTHKNRRGEDEYIYPTIRWEDLKLRDKSAKLSFMMQGVQGGFFSVRTFVEDGLGYDFDNEIENMRLENMAEVFSSPTLGLGTGGVDGGGYGGGGPVMPPEMMGGGGMPPMDMGGGGMPPINMGGEMGGGEMEAPLGGAIPTADLLYKNYKLVFSEVDTLRKENVRTASLGDYIFNNSNVRYSYLEEEPDFGALSDITPSWGKPGCIASLLRYSAKKQQEFNPFANSTKLEAKLHQAILSANIPHAYFMQYAVNADRRFLVDGAFPDIKVAVEADGKTWHLDEEKIKKDRYRDTQLASQGWIVLRFTEDELNDQINDVLNVIWKAVKMRSESQGGGIKTIAKEKDKMNK